MTEVNCERFSARIDIPTCLARQQTKHFMEQCEGCEEGARIMKEHGMRKEGEFIIEQYPSGKPKITGICQGCGERKVVISKKNPTCAQCRKTGKIKHHKQGKEEGSMRRQSGKKRIELGTYEFSIDLTHFKEIAHKIAEEAREEVRSIEDQIVYRLKEHYGS